MRQTVGSFATGSGRGWTEGGARVNRMSVAVACRRRTGDASASRRVRMKDGAGCGDVVGATRPAADQRSVVGSMLVISSPPPIITPGVRCRR